MIKNDLDFSTSIVVLNGKITSVARFNQSTWAWCIYNSAIRIIQPILKKYSITGVIKIHTENQKLILDCLTGHIQADCEMMSAINDRQRDFVLFHTGEGI